MPAICIETECGLVMPEVSEYVVNVKLAEILSEEFSIDCRAERVVSRRRPDVRCYYRGFRIGVEASYDRVDAEKDAEQRIEKDLADIAIALWIKTRYNDTPEQELHESIKRSRFDVKIFIPIEPTGLLKYIESRSGLTAEPATQWLTDIDIPTLGALIKDSIEFVIKEEDVEARIKELQSKISDFIRVLSSLESARLVRENIYNILYKLYGLSVTEAREPEIVFGHAGLSIFLSAIFYEHVRFKHGLPPLSEYVGRYGAIEGLRRALEDLLKIDYRVALELAIEILNTLPGEMSRSVESLIDLAHVIASNVTLLRKDFAGRVYHKITGDIAVRKGFATFYTEVPAAYLLAYLATLSLLGLDRRDIPSLTREEALNVIEKIKEVKVGDLACGSGTLLTASYSALMRIASELNYYHYLNLGLDEVGRMIVENNIYGIDALRYASQITAINLALIAPGTISKENIFTIYLGVTSNRIPLLGSLELINDSKKVGGLLAFIEKEFRETVKRTTVEGVEGKFSIPETFDLIIMNPPFTRATGRTEGFTGSRGLFGFIADENSRKILIDAYEKVKERVREDLRSIAEDSSQILPAHIQRILKGEEGLKQYLAIGQAGEALLFLYLAYRYVKDGGVIAFVLPRTLLAGVSWFLARVLLATKFHLKYVVVSNDPERGYNFSESTLLSETLIVAERTDTHSDDEETVFINLVRKPSSALEASTFASEIIRSTHRNTPYVELLGRARATITRIHRKELLEHVNNWHVFVATPDSHLLDVYRELTKGYVVGL